jgi:hypothetical protein
MRRGLETGSRQTYTGTKLETAETAKGAYGVPRQSSTLPLEPPQTLRLSASFLGFVRVKHQTVREDVTALAGRGSSQHSCAFPVSANPEGRRQCPEWQPYGNHSPIRRWLSTDRERPAAT